MGILSVAKAPSRMTETRLDLILQKAKQQMDEVLTMVADDLKNVKTGRARPNLIEDIKVEAYETTMRLRELASISAPDPHSLVVSPWDKTVIKALEKAIAISDLHLSPIVDNDLIRIQIPPLTEETRHDLVKLVYQKLESGRRLLRQVRNDIKGDIEGSKGKPGVSEDDIHKGIEELQKLVDEFSLKIESLGEAKEKELMTI
jgi:ribosome recycling factor